MKFGTFYTNRPAPISTVPDTETKFVDESEGRRASLKYQLERFGMDSLLHQFEKVKSQFGYADTRLAPKFGDLLNQVAEAQSYFMQLPAKMRAEFGHSAMKFYESLEKQPKEMYERGYISKDNAIKLGIIKEEINPVIQKETIQEVVEPVVNNSENLSA